MGGKAAAFRPDDPLTAGELDRPRRRADRTTAAPIALNPTAPVTIAQLDAQLVRALGLLPAARQFTAAIRAAGLTPTRRFGTEVGRAAARAARQPSRRRRTTSSSAPTTSPPARRPPTRPRASSASHGGEARPGRRKLAATFQPARAQPGYQRAVLQTAVSFVGYPYVWGGTSELPQDPFGTGTLVPGGFDCSGFVWRVYKLQAYAGGDDAAGRRSAAGRPTR